MVIYGDQPVLPHRHAAVAIRVNVTRRLTRNSAADFEDLWFAARVEIGQLYPDVEFGDRSP